MKKIVKNNLGFTLVEIMIAAGITSIIGLIAYSSLRSSNRVGTTSMVNSETSFVKNLVIANMSNPTACENTFKTKPIVNSAIPLLDRFGVIFLAPGQTIYEQVAKNSDGSFNRKPLFQINSVDTVAVPGATNALRINVTYTLKSTIQQVSKQLVKSFSVDVFVVKSASATVTSCFVDTAGMINKAVKAGCDNTDPDNNGALYDALNNTCTHDVQVNTVNVAPGAAGISCADDEFLKASSTTGKGPISFTCAKYDSSANCPAGFYMKGLNADGSPVCIEFASLFSTPGYALSATATGYQQVDLNCGTDQVLRRAVPKLCAPKVITASCGSGQYISNVDAAGNVTCQSARKTTGTCPSGQYVSGVTSNGSVTCQDFYVPATCGANYVLQAANSAGIATACQSSFWPYGVP